MARRDNRQLLIYTGVFAAPLIVIQLLGGVTSSTEASTPDAEDMLQSSNDGAAPFALPTLSETEQIARDYVRSLAEESFGAFPFVFEAPQQSVPVTVGPRTLTAKINAIMNSSSGPTALIDGNLVRVGDDIGDGDWIVQSIDPDGRTVVFREQESGRLVTKTVAPHF